METTIVFWGYIGIMDRCSEQLSDRRVWRGTITSLMVLDSLVSFSHRVPKYAPA